jgi:hypothetical protein
MQRMQNDLAAGQREKASNELRAVEETLMEIQEEGAAISRESRSADS